MSNVNEIHVDTVYVVKQCFDRVDKKVIVSEVLTSQFKGREDVSLRNTVSDLGIYIGTGIVW